MLYLLQRAQQVSATLAMRKFCQKADRCRSERRTASCQVAGLRDLINASPTADEALATVEKAKEFAEANDMSTANLLLSEVSLRLQAGDGEGFQKAIETISTRHGNEPEVMAQLQQMLMSYGLIRPDGSARPAPGAGAGGIDPRPRRRRDRPDYGRPTAVPRPSPDSGGEKKLWIPGMD